MGSEATEPRWLTADELETWKTLQLMMALLTGALGEQLQRDSNLSFLEYYVLAGLSDQPDHTMRLSQLAILANSELSRLSHLMRRLENRGLVRREPDPEDGRFTNATLTDDGWEKVVATAPGHVAAVRRFFAEVLEPEQLQHLGGAVDALLGRLAPGDCG